MRTATARHTAQARTARHALAALVAVAAVVRPAAAQAPTAPRPSDRAGRGVVTLAVAVEPAVVLTLGYLHPVGGAHRDARAGVRLKVPTTAFRNDAWRLDLVVTGTPGGGGSGWAVPVTGAVYAAHDRNRAGSMLGIGTELRAAPGRYGSRGALALDLGWQAALRTRVRHAAAARATFDDRHPGGADAAVGIAGPVDGWYGGTATRWRLGVAGSRATGERTVLQLAAGMLVAPQRQGVLLGFDLAQIPFYAEAGVRLGW